MDLLCGVLQIHLKTDVSMHILFGIEIAIITYSIQKYEKAKNENYKIFFAGLIFHTAV